MNTFDNLSPRDARDGPETRCVPVLLGVLLATIAGCGGSADEAITIIDTSALSSHEAVADAVAAERGAPGENESARVVLTGKRATGDTIEALRTLGFEHVQAASQ